ncbi:Hypothetical protein FKW44_004208, partial [Caligus rogercresseyi]
MPDYNYVFQGTIKYSCDSIHRLTFMVIAGQWKGVFICCGVMGDLCSSYWRIDFH